MSGKKKLSVRLRESAKDQIEEWRKSNFVTKLLACGELNDYTIALAHYEAKEGLQTVDHFAECYRNGIKLTTNESEKAFFESVDFKVMVTEHYEQVFKPVFGAIPDEYWAIPQYPNNKQSGDLAVKVSKEGPVIRLLAVLFCAYISSTDLYDYTKELPHFKPNPFHDILTYHSVGIHKAYEMLSALIDAKEPLSPDEEKSVFDTFRTQMVLEGEYFAHIGRHWGKKDKLR